MKLLDKVIYEMVEGGTLLINKDLQVRLHPRISETLNIDQANI